MRELRVAVEPFYVDMRLKAGAVRKMHRHPNSDEMQFYITGQARMTIFAANGNALTFDFQAGTVSYVPRPMGHYIENTGTKKRQFLELERSDKFSYVSLRQWLMLTPVELVERTCTSTHWCWRTSPSSKHRSCRLEKTGASPHPDSAPAA
jgi:oxalate decarboxylase/phosphoglucose isomerase-like protein (cupin superfamily)